MILIIVALIPQNGILRNPANGSILDGSAFIAGIVTLIALMFLIPGIFYGLGAGTVKNDKTIVEAMSKAMASMGEYLNVILCSNYSFC